MDDLEDVDASPAVAHLGSEADPRVDLAAAQAALWADEEAKIRALAAASGPGGASRRLRVGRAMLARARAARGGLSAAAALSPTLAPRLAPESAGVLADFKALTELPLARLKRIMKSDEDVRMISAEAPVLFAKVRPRAGLRRRRQLVARARNASLGPSSSSLSSSRRRASFLSWT